jgi:hypothetical protein
MAQKKIWELASTLGLNLADKLPAWQGTDEGGETVYMTLEQILDFFGTTPSGSRVISSEVIITSNIAGILNAQWVNDIGLTYTLTNEALVFLGTPAPGNFRWDLVELLNDGTKNVNSGVVGEAAVRPTPTAGALVAEEIIWNDAGEATQIKGPGNSNSNVWSILRFTTQVAADTTGKFAKIWEGNLSKDNNYAIDILYNDPREVTTFGGSGVGRMKVSFTADPSRNIVSNTVKFHTDPDGLDAEFRLVEISGNKAALYHKGSHFFSRIDFRIVFHSSAVRLQDFVNLGVYGSAPTAVATWNSTVMTNSNTVLLTTNQTVNGIKTFVSSPIVPVPTTEFQAATKGYVDGYFKEWEERANNTVLFDKNYVIGNAGARSGNILFDFTGAKLGAETEMRHNTASAFTFPAQAKLMFDVADISTTADNFFLFVLTKKSSTEIVKVFHALEGGV